MAVDDAGNLTRLRALKARRGAVRMAEGVLGEHGETGAAAWVRCERCGEWTEDLGREGPVVCGVCRVAAGEAVERVCPDCGGTFVATTDPGEEYCAVCWGERRTRGDRRGELVGRAAEAAREWEQAWEIARPLLQLGLATVAMALGVGVAIGLCYVVGLLLARS